jgi:putative transposase
VYSKYQRKKALELYDQYRSVSKIIQQLGYPTRHSFFSWLDERDLLPKNKTPRRNKTIVKKRDFFVYSKLKLFIHTCIAGVVL